MGAFFAIVSIAMLITFMLMRWRFFKGRGGWNSTLAFFNCTYMYFLGDGILWLFRGSWRIAVLPRPAEAPAMIVVGVLGIAPFLGIFLYGRQKLFHVMARRFEDKRRKFDSAVIAQLMDNTDFRVGQEWWVHHGKNLADEYPDTFDHRRNFTRGVIVKVESGRYAVDVAVEQLPLNPGEGGGRSFFGGGRSSKSSFFGGGRSFFGRRRDAPTLTGGGSGSLFGRRKIAPERALSGGGSLVGRRNVASERIRSGAWGSLFKRHKVAPDPTPLVWIALPSSAKLKAEELLKNAMDNLRLLDGQYVTHGLLATYVVCRDGDQ